MLGICNKISSFFKPLFVCLFALLFTCNAYAAYNFSDSMSHDGSGGDLSLVVNFNVLPESSFISGSVDGVRITETLDYVPYHPSMDYTTYGMVGNQFDEFDDWTLGDILNYVADEIAPNVENPIVRCQFLDAQYAHKTDSEFSAYEALADGLHFDTALGAMKWLNAFSFTPETGQCWFFGNREIDCSTTLHDVADLYLQSLTVLEQEGLVEMMERYIDNPMSANGSYYRDSNMIENITEQDIRELNIERRISCYVIPADDFDVKSGYPMIVDGTSLYNTGMWRDGFGDNISNKILMNHPGDIMYHLMDMDNMTGDGFVLAAGDPNSAYFDVNFIGDDFNSTRGLLPLAYTTKNGRYVNLIRALNDCLSPLAGVNLSCAYDAYGTPDCPTPQNHDILSADEFNSILNDPSLVNDVWVSENFVDYAVNLRNYPFQNSNGVWNPFGYDFGTVSSNNMEICSALGINAPYCGWGFTDGTANWFVLLPVSLDSGSYDTDYYGEICGSGGGTGGGSQTITYSVQYNANGGSGTMENSSHTYGVAKTLTANAFTRTGYTFNGWNTAADGTGTSYSNGASVTNLTSTNGATVNLYAQWKIASCSCTNGTGATGCVGTLSGSSCNYTWTCQDGYYNSTQSVTNNSVTFTATCNACSAPYTHSDGGRDSVTDCYRDCTTSDLANSTSVSGKYYSTGNNYCSADTCAAGYFRKNQVSDTGKPQSEYMCSACPASYPNHDAGSAGAEYCYTSCATKPGYTLQSGGRDYYSAADTCSYTACTYSVKYNANGGSGTMSNSSHTYDTAKALTANTFTRAGYTFAGWNTAADGSGTSYSDGASVKNLTSTCGGTVNLYAKWTGNPITLQFANGGRGTAPTSPASCTYGNTFTMPAAMTATGYTFNKWSVNSKTFAAGASVTCNYTNLGVYSGTATITGTWNATTNNSCAAGYYWAGTKCTLCSSEYYCPGVSNGVYDGGIKGREACPTPENTFEAMSVTLLSGTTTDSNYDGVRDSITDCATRYMFAPSSYATSNSSGVDADYNANNNMNKVGLWSAACHWNTTTNAYDSNCSGGAFWCAAGYYSPQAQNISSVNEAAAIVYSAETMTELATQVCVPVGANYWSPNAANPAGFDVASLKRVACPTNSSTSGNTVNASCTCNTGYNYNGGTTTTTNACVANKYTITLDANGGTGGTATLYTTYATGVYT
ncbi:MAG: InlB B-repeat-containing protein, partial [Alphaproteobacteria bacterium]